IVRLVLHLLTSTFHVHQLAHDVVAPTSSYLFFFAETSPTDIYPLSLHDALPISALRRDQEQHDRAATEQPAPEQDGPGIEVQQRSEEHTSELQSRFDLVCRLLLEKKKREA